MGYENYTVSQFKRAWFNDDRTEIDEETFNQVYIEYIDASGLYSEEEYNLLSYMQYLNGRMNFITNANKLQLDFLEEFGKPFIPYFEEYQKYGYNLKWNNDKDNFIQQLKRVESCEKPYVSELEKTIKELFNKRKEKESGIVSKKQTRVDFIKTVIFLGKVGYKINEDRTTVEELSLMILQQKEENKNLENERSRNEYTTT